MRTEQEMMELILDFARQEDRIRVVTLEGSRTNPNVPKDHFQDYDITFIVTEMSFFVDDPNWIDIFGERIIMQMPEAMSMFPPDLGNYFSYLMLFTDGNRIDLTLVPIEEKESYRNSDKLLQVLLDKDNGLLDLPPATDVDYWAKRPSAEFFADCCNEFWWVSTYVAKGMWRKEILYAIDHLQLYVRPMLMKMLEWHVGTQTHFSLSVGKNGKYLERYLSRERWELLMATYPKADYEQIWNSLFAMGELFRTTATEVADHLGYNYPLEEDRQVTAYLHQVKSLPSDAKTM